jgi:hypothetical protein
MDMGRCEANCLISFRYKAQGQQGSGNVYTIPTHSIMSKQGGLRKKMNRIMMMVKEYENGEYREDILLSFPSHSTPEPTGQLSAESVQAEDTPNKVRAITIIPKSIHMLHWH